MLPNIGPLEVVIVLIIALIVFGPKRLPELGKSLGRGINEFRDGLSNVGQEDDEDEDDDDAEPAELSPPPTDAEHPLPGEEPEVTEVTGSGEAESVDGEVVPDSRN